MKKTILQLNLFLTVALSFAQVSPKDKLGIWYDLGINHRISEKTSLETYAQLWTYEVNNNFNFILFKLGYNYHFTTKLTATMYLGYSDFDGDINMSSPHTYESRLTEQVSFKHKLGKIPLDHRLRVEHRFFRKQDSKPKAARLRYRIGSKLTLSKTLFLRINNELLLTPKFDSTAENRFYTGLGFNISKSNNVQFGYMNRNTANKTNLHRLQIGLFFKVDYRKK